MDFLPFSDTDCQRQSERFALDDFFHDLDWVEVGRLHVERG